jgi:DNA-binding NtrC family response regulator
MVMPDGISGRDLVAELRSRNPEVKCIFASGYNPFQNEENEDLIEGVNFLQKPYHAHKLGEVIRRMLDREEKVIVHI